MPKRFCSIAQRQRPGNQDKIVLHGRILLAEDGLDNQRLISLLLRNAGAHVTVVENGQLAIEAALAAREAGKPFDVILMDMQMPVMDGYEATAAIGATRATPLHRRPDGVCDGRGLQKCLDAGCNDYLPKPFQHPRPAERMARQYHCRERGKPLLPDDAKPSAASGERHNDSPDSSTSKSNASYDHRRRIWSIRIWLPDPDLGELVDLFVQEMPDRINAIDASGQEPNGTNWPNCAPEIKGAAGLLWVRPRSHPTAARLEAAARDAQQEEQIFSALDELLTLCPSHSLRHAAGRRKPSEYGCPVESI